MTDETQGIADARETLDLVLTAALGLARRAIEHVGEHESAGVSFATVSERFPVGGFSWDLTAKYAVGSAFVLVEGTPRPTGNPGLGIFASIEELATVMGNEGAAFRASVPRAWVELAGRAAAAPVLSEAQR